MPKPNILTVHRIFAKCPHCAAYAHVHESAQPGPMQNRLNQINQAFYLREEYMKIKCSKCSREFDIVPNEK